jgi:ATP-dependent DNA helicase RecQ
MAVFAEDAEAVSNWTRIREAVLARDGHRCRNCGGLGHGADLDVHHLIPRAAGGSDDPSNLITLCDGCHAARHPNLQVALSRRMIERWAVRVAQWLDRQHELPDELSDLTSALRLFRKQRLREGQLEAVLTALHGDSMLVVRPTGSGKTLCFQLPAVLREGTTMILSPLKALMRSQVADLQELQLPGTFINGDLSPDEKAARYDLLERGVFKFLYVTPERFNRERLYNAAEVDLLAAVRPAFLVVDEAHCVDRWGADFRPDYDRIGQIREQLGNPPVLAFTATAGRKAQDRILKSLGVEGAKRLITGADRPNIALVRHTMPSGDEATSPAVKQRGRLIAKLVQSLGSGRAMIFVPTKRIGEALRQAMAAEGLNLPFYHANAGTANDRDMILQRFRGRQDPPLRAVICTNAFGMGIDVPDVRLVINWQHPASVEDYLQEFGRAGRDGRPALGVLLSEGGNEKRLWEWMVKKNAATAADPVRAHQALEAKLLQLEALNGLVTDKTACFRTGLLDYLVGPERLAERRSLSRRVLEWIFGERIRVKPAGFCCDVCHPDDALLALDGHFLTS